MIQSVIFAVLSLSVAAQAGVAERAQRYNQRFGTGSIESTVRNGVSGTRKLMTVLPGALYRGGGPGGMRPLPDSSLRALCEAGFSLAVYSYTEGFSHPGPVSCTDSLTGRPNTLEYIAGNANDGAFKQKFLARVRAVIADPSRGPVFVHCWNGFHASGELAAVALRQFCGYSGEEASAYWQRHSGGFPMISRIARFTPIAGLGISGEAQSQLCR